MKNKVVYIAYQPLTQKVYKDFFISEFKSKYFQVEYWDLSKIYNPEITFDDILDLPLIKKISSFKSLDLELDAAKKDSTLFVLLITYNYKVISLFRKLTKHRCTISIYARGAQPLYSYPKKIRSLKIFDIRKVFLYIKQISPNWLKKIGYIKPYDLVFNAGNLGLSVIGFGWEVEKSKSSIVQINHFDFDNYNMVKNESNILSEKYCVFLDEYLPFHPDFSIFSISTINEKLYYELINNFFNEIEKITNLKVVIAAHPKATKYKSSNYFNGRLVYFDKTAQLIVNSEFVIAHCSTSISYAVLSQKPILFVFDDNIKNNMKYFYNNIISFAQNLDCNIVNYSEPLPINFNKIKINYNFYNNYKYNYLTNINSESFNSLKIIYETLIKV